MNAEAVPVLGCPNVPWHPVVLVKYSRTLGLVSVPECSQGRGRAKVVLQQRRGLMTLCWQRVLSVTETSCALSIQDIPVRCLIGCCCVIPVLLGSAVATAFGY